MIDDAFGHWLAGFIDGEGCFMIVPQRSGSFSCEFVLGVRLDDERIIREIHERTGLGNVNLNAERRNPRWGPRIHWMVRSKAECAALVRLLDQYSLRAKKAADYAIWREAVSEWTKYGRGRPHRDKSRMEALYAALTSLRRYAGGDVEREALPTDPQLRIVS
jgi:hypothetical protein